MGISVTLGNPGTLDTSFGGGGEVVTSVLGSSFFNESLALQPDGKIVVGATQWGGDINFALLRYNADGSLDNGFGVGGMVNTAIGAGGGMDQAAKVLLQPDDKILLAGYASDSGDFADFALVRYNSNGSPDTGFGTGGIVRTALSATDDFVAGAALQADGKIVLSGYIHSNLDLEMVRYGANGSLDAAFDGDGKLISAAGNGLDQHPLVQPDGKTLVAFSAWNGGDYDFGLLRFNANGSPDSAFGAGGKATAAIGTGSDYVKDVALQPDGKILVAGQSLDGANGWVFSLARFNADGSLDTGFDGDGRLTADVSPATDGAFGVAVQPNGKILLFGTSNGFSADFTVVCYNPDGSLDTGFGTAGKVSLPVGAFTGAGADIALQADGRILLAGCQSDQNGVALVRIFGNTNHVAGTSGNDTLTGASGEDTLNGGAGNDILSGGGGADRLDGGAGKDSMTGGAGDDLFIVDNSGDKVLESGGGSGGYDLAISSVSYTLPGSVEALFLDAGAVNGTGNAQGNFLLGNSAADSLSGLGGNDLLADLGGNDTLDGGAGADSIDGGTGNDNLTGGAGNDKFVFDTALNATHNRDTILDFTSGDRIQLDNDIFKKLGTSAATTGLAATKFLVIGAHVQDTNDYVVYNHTTGVLSYDADGSGSGAAVQFAILSNHPTLVAADFQVVD